MIIHDCKQGSPEWFQLHCGIPSASEFDRIITPGGKLCKAERSTDYRNRKLAEWITGEVVYDQQYESLHMALGKENEPFAAKAFTLQTGRKVREVGFITSDDGLVGASPDRLIEGGGMLEIKSPAMSTHIGYLLDPATLIADYRVQVHAEAWISETDEAWIMSYHPKLPPLILRVPLDTKSNPKDDLTFMQHMQIAVEVWVLAMMTCREELEQRFGPFVRKTQETEENPFGVTMADAEAIIESWGKK